VWAIAIVAGPLVREGGTVNRHCLALPVLEGPVQAALRPGSGFGWTKPWPPHHRPLDRVAGWLALRAVELRSHSSVVGLARTALGSVFLSWPRATPWTLGFFLNFNLSVVVLDFDFKLAVGTGWGKPKTPGRLLVLASGPKYLLSDLTVYSVLDFVSPSDLEHRGPRTSFSRSVSWTSSSSLVVPGL
jgi:hypothetical protein